VESGFFSPFISDEGVFFASGFLKKGDAPARNRFIFPRLALQAR
jgi:hypothetical protein